jgi:4-amino-4-deoxy-L-arabinose transferase-like glycosyltransferase
MRRSPRIRTLLIEHLLPLALIAAFFALFWGLSVTDRFSFRDEHTYLMFVRPELRTHGQISDDYFSIFDSLGDAIFVGEPFFGRFRPMYWTMVYVEAVLFNGSILAVHLSTLAFGIVTVYLLFRTARTANLPYWIAGLFALWTAVGSNGDIWWETMVVERYAMLFLAAALLTVISAARRGQARALDALAVVWLTLMGLTKEPFVPLIPLLVLLRLALTAYWHDGWTLRRLARHFAVFVAVCALISAALAAGVYNAYRLEGFGARVVGDFGGDNVLVRWLEMLAAPAALYLYLLPALGLLPAMLRLWRTARGRTLLVSAALIAAGWLLSQLVLYASRGRLDNYYAYPLVVALAALVSLGISALWHQRSRLPRLIALGFTALALAVILEQASLISLYASRHTTDSVHFDRIMRTLEPHLTDGGSVVIVEAWSGSAVNHRRYPILWMAQNGGYLNPVYGHIINYDPDAWPEIERRYTNNNQFEGPAIPEDFDPTSACCLIALGGEARLNSQPPAWFDPADWTYQPITSEIYRVRPRGIIPVETLNDGVYLRRTTR